MRFGSKQRAVLGQFEVGIGLLPGGGGTQHLPALVGRARALEIILSGADFDADVAEQYGWLNRALPDESLRPFVRSLAARMAQHPPQALRLAKQSVDASQPDRYEGLREEAGLFARLLSTDDAARLLRQFVADGGQTRAGELDIQPLLDRLSAGRGASRSG
jgi:enoyl-CoA hydratase/carnithine racemase